MPTTLTLHGQDVALLIAGIISLVVLAAIWGSVATSTAAARRTAPARRRENPFTRMRASARRRTYTGRHWATA